MESKLWQTYPQTYPRFVPLLLSLPRPFGILVKNPVVLLLVSTILSTTLLGCSAGSKPVDVKEQADTVNKDLDKLYNGQDAVKAEIGLYDAMARGIKYNIEKRDAVMSEMVAKGDIDLKALDMLPDARLRASANGRNDKQYLSGRSKATGGQSLEPTQFEDQYTRTANLALSWNTLDAGLGFISTKQASDKARAVTERRRKVVQNIAQDIREAYWRAASAQLLDDQMDGLMKESKALAKKLEDAENRKSNKDVGNLLTLQKRMYDTMQDLMAERDHLATAHIELAALMGLPPSTKFRLADDEAVMMSKDSIPTLKSDVKDLEVLALMIRPEMREQNLLKRVSTGDMHKTVLETFPGIGGILAYNYDDNSFLDDESWMSASLGLTQNVMKIFSFPQRYKQAGNLDAQADVKRMAMTAAVLTQMNIAYTRYDLAQDRYDLLKSMAGVNRRMQDYAETKVKNSKDKDLVDDAQLLSAKMDSLLTRTRLQLAYAEGQNSFGRIVNTLGLDPLPPHVEDQTTDQLAKTIETRFENLDADVIASLLQKIREKTNLLDGNTGVASKLVAPQNVSYQTAVVPKPKMSDNKGI